MQWRIVGVEEPGSVTLTGYGEREGPLPQVRYALSEILERSRRILPGAPHVLLDASIRELPVSVASACDTQLAAGEVESDRLDYGRSGVDADDDVSLHASYRP